MLLQWPPLLLLLYSSSSSPSTPPPPPSLLLLSFFPSPPPPLFLLLFSSPSLILLLLCSTPSPPPPPLFLLQGAGPENLQGVQRCPGGDARDLADTVRRVLSAVATDAVWSSYSVHAKKGKKPLKSMALFNVITRT